MRIDIKILRWILLFLYIAIVVGLFWFSFSKNDWVPLWLLIVAVVAQILFIFGSGTTKLCEPIHPRRLLIPVIVASLAMTVLVAGMFLALFELADLSGNDWFTYVFWGGIGMSWIGWGIVFFIWQRRKERYKVIRNLIYPLLAGSLIELMVSIPSHIIVSRRPGCFVGIATTIAIACGVGVMLWAFGPGIILLFLKERRKKEL